MTWHAPHKKQKKKKNRRDKNIRIKLTKLFDLIKRCRKCDCCPAKTKTDVSFDILNVDRSVLDRPKKGDKLFKETTDFNDLSVIGRFGKKSDFMIIIGFYEIAINSLINLQRKGAKEQDSQIYPIIYNFRHYLELCMKQTIRHFRLVKDEIKDDEVGYKKNHNLMNLWSDLKSYLSEIEDITDEETVAFEELINELNDIDKNSFAFRYHCDRAQNIHDKITLTIPKRKDISLNNLKEVMGRMYNYIEGISELARCNYENTREINN